MKQKMKKLVHQLWTDESGQGTAEYALIIVAVVTLAFVFRQQIKDKLNTFMDEKVGGALNSFGVEK